METRHRMRDVLCTLIVTGAMQLQAASDYPVHPVPFTDVRVSRFDGTGPGACRLPASWRVLYQGADEQWQPVASPSAYGVRKADPVRVTFDPVETRGVRLEVQLPKDDSAGVYEWEVESSQSLPAIYGTRITTR